MVSLHRISLYLPYDTVIKFKYYCRLNHINHQETLRSWIQDLIDSPVSLSYLSFSDIKLKRQKKKRLDVLLPEDLYNDVYKYTGGYLQSIRPFIYNHMVDFIYYKENIRQITIPLENVAQMVLRFQGINGDIINCSCDSQNITIKYVETHTDKS